MERAIPWAVVVLLLTVPCFLWPRPMRVVLGVFFGLMGLGVHGAFVATNPESYVDFAGQALFPFYRDLAVAVVTTLSPVVFGVMMLVFEVSLAVLILGKGRTAKLGLLLAAIFLVIITPLGIEVVPNIVLAVGLIRVARESFETSVPDDLRRWLRNRGAGVGVP